MVGSPFDVSEAEARSSLHPVGVSSCWACVHIGLRAGPQGFWRPGRVPEERHRSGVQVVAWAETLGARGGWLSGQEPSSAGGGGGRVESCSSTCHICGCGLHFRCNCRNLPRAVAAVVG